MIRAFRSEWIKLRRPGILLTAVLGTVAFSVVGVLIGLRRVGRDAGLSAGLLSQHDGFVRMMSNAADFLGIVALGVTAYAVASEYTNGTIRSLLVRQPHRLRLLAGKALALGSLVTLVVVLAYAVSFPVALAFAPSHGIDTSSWTGGSGIASLAAGTGDMVLSALGFALLGGMLGMLFRNPAPAIVTGIAYMIPVEALLVGADSSMRNILFGQQLSAIAATGLDAAVGYGSALLVGAAWVVAAAVTTGASFQRRDVVA